LIEAHERIVSSGCIGYIVTAREQAKVGSKPGVRSQRDGT